jgi:hypothetical protein
LFTVQIDVNTDSRHNKVNGVSRHFHLRQNSTDFFTVDQDIIGPLEQYFAPAIRAKGFGHCNTGSNGNLRRVRRFEMRAQNNGRVNISTRRGMPDALHPAFSPALAFGNQHRTFRRALNTETKRLIVGRTDFFIIMKLMADKFSGQILFQGFLIQVHSARHAFHASRDSTHSGGAAGYERRLTCRL